MSALNAKLDQIAATLDAFEASVNARFGELEQTMATNLALTLEAIEKLGASREMRSANVEQTRRTALQAIRDRPT